MPGCWDCACRVLALLVRSGLPGGRRSPARPANWEHAFNGAFRELESLGEARHPSTR